MKPIALEIEEARDEFLKSIQVICEKHKLDPYFLEMIVDNIHKDIALDAKNEINNIIAALNKNAEIKKEGEKDEKNKSKKVKA